VTPLAYTGFRPTSRYIGFVWRGVAIIGVEIAPDAFGFIVFGLWFGFVKEG
jgi:hypothetical protein